MKDAGKDGPLFPRPRTASDDPWLRVPAGYPARSGRLGGLPVADLILLVLLLVLAFGHP